VPSARRVSDPAPSAPPPLARDVPTSSRFNEDFEYLATLGRGGFGTVMRVRNKVDGRIYAVKKVKLEDRDPDMNRKIMREVTLLSQLHHQYVVRYYNAWIEGGDEGSGSELEDGFSFDADSLTDDEDEALFSGGGSGGILDGVAAPRRLVDGGTDFDGLETAFESEPRRGWVTDEDTGFIWDYGSSHDDDSRRSAISSSSDESESESESDTSASDSESDSEPGSSARGLRESGNRTVLGASSMGSVVEGGVYLFVCPKALLPSFTCVYPQGRPGMCCTRNLWDLHCTTCCISDCRPILCRIRDCGRLGWGLVRPSLEAC
jgi:protein kinase-like protein